MHTKDLLANALDEAGLPLVAARARRGHYHDYLSPLDFPQIALATELLQIGTLGAMAVRERLIDGAFDATDEEADDWAASPDGRATAAKLVRP